MKYLGDTPFEMTPSEYKEWLVEQEEKEKEKKEYEIKTLVSAAEKRIEKIKNPPKPLRYESHETFSSIVKGEKIFVDKGEWHSSAISSKKYWHTIKKEAYVVKIKRIKANPKEAIAVIRIKENREIVFALLPDDIGSFILGVRESKACGDVVAPYFWSVGRMNRYLNESYGVQLQWLDSFDEIEVFKYQCKG